MDWDKLRIFKAVADAGSFTHAGDVLNLSQSAISRQISTLEKSLGLTLFHRHARGLVLTEQGEMLLNTTHEVFEKLERVQTRLQDSSALPEGPLSLTTVEFIASTWLIPQIPSFRALYPKIEITLLLNDRIYDLNRRESDVAIRLHKVENNDLIERHMTSIEFSLCASKDYLARNGKPTKPKDFQDHLVIGYPRNTHTPFRKPNWTLNTLGIELDNNPNVLLINSMHARYSAVKDSVGISVLPQYLIRQDSDIEVLMPDLKIPSVDMYFVYPQERKHSNRIKVLRDFLFHNIK